MKKNHFNISNFSGILSGMSSGKNIDTFLNEQIGNCYFEVPSEGFEEELKKRIALENEFRKQDVKTDKIAKTVIASVVAALMFLIGLTAFVLNQTKSQTSDRVSGTIESFSSTIETISLQLTSMVGLSVTSQAGAVLLVLMLSFLLYTFAEKFLLKRSAGRSKQI